MIFPQTIDNVLNNLQQSCHAELIPPFYNGSSSVGIVLGVESMRRHTTDEGWQIQAAFESSGYTLCGYNLPVNETDVYKIVNDTEPGVVLLQDKREWDVIDGDFREPQAKFQNVDYLRVRDDIFKLTILKDSHRKPSYHKASAAEIDCHAWIVYYHPRIVKHLAPYVREEHLIRTYHTLDKAIVPKFSPNRDGVFLSGAVSPVYPLRQYLIANRHSLFRTDYLKHPGYDRVGCYTPEYLQTLSHYKIAICTASMYGYALRKIIEATACGCVVVTDLPQDEVIPEIDGNLVRIHPSTTVEDLNPLLEETCNSYDPELQSEYATKAINRFDFRTEGSILARKVEELRCSYNKRNL